MSRCRWVGIETGQRAKIDDAKLMMTNKRKRAASSSAATAPPSSTRNHRTRPGVEDAARLVALAPISNFITSWDVASSHYDAMILAKGGKRLSELDRRRENLATDWRREKNTTTDTVGCMTKEQLLNVVIEWKFLKGKPRHALKPLLRSNSEKSVIEASTFAFAAANEIPEKDSKNKFTNRSIGDDNTGQHRDNDEITKRQITSAINHLCELKGVGPATASAVLCLIRPDAFAFMDDEVIECLLPNKKRGYTLGIYMEMNDRCRAIAEELNRAMAKCGGDKKKKEKSTTNDEKGGDMECVDNGSSLEEWTSYKVGRALWACATVSATKDEAGLAAIFKN